MPTKDNGSQSVDTGLARVAEGRDAAFPPLEECRPEIAGVSEPVPPSDGTITATASVNLPFVIHPEPTGGFWAEVPSLPGCVTEGETLEEIRANIKDAAEGWLLVNHDRETGVSAIAPANP